ncbi:hypothetical protein WDW86_15490 [Bdellovibrionota bacterium FG-2]
MATKFNPKTYQDKGRIFNAIPSAPRISRLWKWNPEKAVYEAVSDGKPFMSRRGKGKSRETGYFETIDGAKAWRDGIDIGVNPLSVERKTNSTKKFSDIIEDWKRRSFSKLAPGTVRQYEKLLKHHFGSLLMCHMDELDEVVIDKWIDELTNPVGWRMQIKNRQSFTHEMTLVKTILSYYEDRTLEYRHSGFAMPVKRRHFEAVACVRNVKRAPKPKNLKEAEFRLFQENLGVGKYAAIMPLLATLQYFEALRISEAAALHWEDIEFDFENPRGSKITVQRSFDWPRAAGYETQLQWGFKNSKHLEGGVKVLRLFPEAFEALMKLYSPGKKGLVFSFEGRPLEYRHIEHAYNMSFERAALPFRGTHIMRHGGVTYVWKQSGGNALAAKRHAGLKDNKTLATYAHDDDEAIENLNNSEWASWEKKISCDGISKSLAASGCRGDAD